MRSFLINLWRIFKPYKLEDGEIVSCEDGLYRCCPKCQQLVAQAVKMDDDFYHYLESHGVMTNPQEREQYQPLLDLRGLTTGRFNLATGESKTHLQCKVCGLALRDDDGNVLFLNE